MRFNDLKSFLQEEGCTIEHLDENVYMARNCILGEMCLIEDLEFYSTPTLAHYFSVLNTSIPEHIQEFIHVYNAFKDRELAKMP